MKYLVGAMMITVLSCSAAYAEEKPYYRYSSGINVLMEKCLEAYDKGYAVRTDTFNQGNQGATYQYWLLGDYVYRLTFRAGINNREFKCTKHRTALIK